MDPRASQAGSPIALALFDLLADQTSTLRALLRVSDLFCVRLTCKEAWRCIQHRPLTRLGVLKAATDPRGRDHHGPLLRWCLHNGIADLDNNRFYVRTIGEAGDVELVSELLKIEPKTEELLERLLYGAAKAGHDELCVQLLAEFDEPPDEFPTGYLIKHGVASGGCVRTAAAIDDDPTTWVRFLYRSLVKGHQPFVEWVLADVEPDADAKYVALAAKSGSPELVKWLYAKGYAVGGDALRYAAASGNVDLCKWMVDHGQVPTLSAMEAAVEGGHVEVLEWLSTKGYSCTSGLLRHAVRTAGVSVVVWCLDHHSHPPDAGDLLALSCESKLGSDVFEYLADQRGFQSTPTSLMLAAAECHPLEFMDPFDAAILVKRYGTPLYHRYMIEAICLEDVVRLRFALSQGQEVSDECYEVLIEHPDATLLNEVLLARKADGSLPEADHTLIQKTLRKVKCHASAKKVLMDHSIDVGPGG